MQNVARLRSLISSWEPFLFSCPRFWKSLFFLDAAADPQFFHLVNKRCPVQSELRCCSVCASDHPISILQYSYNHAPLDLRKGIASDRPGSCLRCRRTERPGEHSVVRQNYSALNQVLQFTYISGPGIRGDDSHRTNGNLFDWLPHAAAVKLDEMRYKPLNILPALAQGRHGNGKNIQAIVQITPKSILFH